jgi:hypothetical protein
MTWSESVARRSWKVGSSCTTRHTSTPTERCSLTGSMAQGSYRRKHPSMAGTHRLQHINDIFDSEQPESLKRYCQYLAVDARLKAGAWRRRGSITVCCQQRFPRVGRHCIRRVKQRNPCTSSIELGTCCKVLEDATCMEMSAHRCVHAGHAHGALQMLRGEGHVHISPIKGFVWPADVAPIAACFCSGF